MQKVYFIPGLGADKRVFNFLDLSFCEPIFIEWIKPLDAETLSSYAQRLFETIKDEKAVIVGVSFGGMLATEMAKAHSDTKVIIISSAKTYLEIPSYLRFWRRFPLYKLHSEKNKSTLGKFILKILGSKGEEQKKLQLKILENSDPAFTRWATDAILNWHNLTIPKNIVHIHGTADRLLPYKYVKADYTIQDGEHVMIMDKAAEISALLKKLIS